MMTASYFRVAAKERAAMPFRRLLDWLNFFLADVWGVLGPYIGLEGGAG
jgi:hypothetical protein